MGSPLVGPPSANTLAGNVSGTNLPPTQNTGFTPAPGQNMPVPQTPVQPQPAPAPTVSIPAAAAPHLGRMAALGQTFHNIASGGGQPGQMWRNILGGAMAGMSAGAQAKMGGGVGSFAVGMEGAQQRQQQQQAIQRQQAQQQLENQQKQQQLDLSKDDATQRKIFQQAQIAQWHDQAVLEQHKSNLADQEYNDKKNEASQIAFNAVKQAGGVPPVDGSLPASIDAYELAQKYTDTKGQIAKAPAGYTRIFFDTTNGGEAERDPVSGEWTENGKPVDMTTKTSFRVLDVPEDSLNKKAPTNPKVVNDLMGHKMYPEDGPPMMLSPNDVINMSLKKKQLDAQANADARAREEKVAAQYKAAEDAFRFTQDSLAGKLAEIKTNPNPDPAEITALEKQQDQNLADFMAARNSFYPSLRGKPVTVTPPPPPPDTDTVAKVQNTVINTWTPADLRPVVSLYLTGGKAGNTTIPAPANFEEFTRNLTSSQAAVPAAAKLSPAKFADVVKLGKSYFDNLPAAQQAAQKGEDAKKLSLVQAKNPGKNVTEQDLDKYDQYGNLYTTPPVVPVS